MKSLEKYRIIGGGKKNHPETSVNILKSFWGGILGISFWKISLIYQIINVKYYK